MTPLSPPVPTADRTAAFFRDIYTHALAGSDLLHVEHTAGYVLGTAFTPTPDLNLVFVGAGDAGPAEGAARLAARLADFDVPFLCVLAPDAVGAGMGEALTAAGLPEILRMPIMTLDLADLREEDARVPGLELRRVRSDEDLDGWLRVTADAFGFSPATLAVCRAVMRPSALDPASRAHYVLGLLDGEPVGTALTVLGDGEAGVWCIGTATAARRRGVGAAMTTGPLLAARDEGYTAARLGATPAGFPVYTRLGWTVEYEAPTHLSAPAGSAPVSGH